MNTLINRIRTLATKAAKARLASNIQAALDLDAQLDTLHAQAEAQGLEDDAVIADKESREAAR